MRCRWLRKTLTAKFPELWDSLKAAQRWLDKKPLEHSKSNIQVWGVFRCLGDGQKRWSRALIRDGVADCAAALGGVLGVSPELLRVRRSAEPDAA